MYLHCVTREVEVKIKCNLGVKDIVRYPVLEEKGKLSELCLFLNSQGIRLFSIDDVRMKYGRQKERHFEIYTLWVLYVHNNV